MVGGLGRSIVDRGIRLVRMRTTMGISGDGRVVVISGGAGHATRVSIVLVASRIVVAIYS